MNRELRLKALKKSFSDFYHTSKLSAPFIGLVLLHVYFNMQAGRENTAAMLLRVATSKEMLLYYWLPIGILFGLTWYVFYYRAAVYSIRKSSGYLDTRPD